MFWKNKKAIEKVEVEKPILKELTLSALEFKIRIVQVTESYIIFEIFEETGVRNAYCTTNRWEEYRGNVVYNCGTGKSFIELKNVSIYPSMYKWNGELLDAAKELVLEATNKIAAKIKGLSVQN